MSEVPESGHIPQHEMRGISKISQPHNSMLRELSMPLPIIGQGNVVITSSTGLPDSITRMVRVALEENKDADPEKSALARVGIKIPHPGTYSGSADLQELEIFIAGVLQWLKMNQYLGSTNTEFQVNYLGTRLEGEALLGYRFFYMPFLPDAMYLFLDGITLGINIFIYYKNLSTFAYWLWNIILSKILYFSHLFS